VALVVSVELVEQLDLRKETQLVTWKAREFLGNAFTNLQSIKYSKHGRNGGQSGKIQLKAVNKLMYTAALDTASFTWQKVDVI
jgi:hypothetical protein